MEIRGQWTQTQELADPKQHADPPRGQVGGAQAVDKPSSRARGVGPVGLWHGHGALDSKLLQVDPSSPRAESPEQLLLTRIGTFYFPTQTRPTGLTPTWASRDPQEHTGRPGCHS